MIPLAAIICIGVAFVIFVICLIVFCWQYYRYRTAPLNQVPGFHSEESGMGTVDPVYTMSSGNTLQSHRRLSDLSDEVFEPSPVPTPVQGGLAPEMESTTGHESGLESQLLSATAMEVSVSSPDLREFRREKKSLRSSFKSAAKAAAKSQKTVRNKISNSGFYNVKENERRHFEKHEVEHLVNEASETNKDSEQISPEDDFISLIDETEVEPTLCRTVSKDSLCFPFSKSLDEAQLPEAEQILEKKREDKIGNQSL